MRTTRGFSLVELLLALVITLIVSAGVFEVARAAREAAATEPERSDLQQRLRIASDAIAGDLALAGVSGAGETASPLGRAIPAVLPFRAGPVDPDPPGTFKDDTLSVVYAAAGSSQTTLAEPFTTGSSSVVVNATAACPRTGLVRDPACGFAAGMQALIFDDSGAYDHLTITGAAGGSLALEHSDRRGIHTYPAGSLIVQARRVTYYLKTATAQLMRYNGIESDAPAVDNVVALRFEYFASASGGDRLVSLPREELIDGPWRPDAADPNRYDADLLRIRRVAVHLHLRPGTNLPNLPGREVRFDVAPRSLAGEP
jgi:prepilin-type N-terminal cleavage/methylation domain-containing protein